MIKPVIRPAFLMIWMLWRGRHAVDSQGKVLGHAVSRGVGNDGPQSGNGEKAGIDGHKGTLTASVILMTTLMGTFTLTGWLFITKSIGLL